MERIHHRDRVGQFLSSCGLGPGEAVHRDHLELVAPRLGRVASQVLKTCLERPSTKSSSRESPGAVADGPGAVADGCEVDDHGHVLVTTAGVAPHMLIDADHLHTVEPGRVVDQDPPAFGQDRSVGRVPRHA